MVDEQEGCEWMNVSSGTGSPGQTRTKGRKTAVCVCVYYYSTGDRLAPFLPLLNSLLDSHLDIYGDDNSSLHKNIDKIYYDVVGTLSTCAQMHVPKCHKNFFKFWWDQELSTFKEAAVDSNTLWKAAGKPRQGPIFDKRQSSRLAYRRRIREGQKSATELYTNDLHEALLQKNHTAFWRCWRSKIDNQSRRKCHEIEGSVDNDIIAKKFAEHFSSSFSCNNPVRKDKLKEEYWRMRTDYFGFPLLNDITLDTELVSHKIQDLKKR